MRRGGTAISGYVDLFSKIAPARGAVHPARGVDALVRIAVRLSEEVGVEARYRVRETEAGTSAGGGPLPVPGNGTEIERRVRAEVRYDPRAGLESTARFDYCVASPPDGPAGRGGMLTVEIGARAWKRLALEGRLRFFRSSSFESGIPAVETMIPGTIASSVYWGEGVAWSAGAALTWSRHVRLSVRYTFLRRDDLRRIGSGPSALPSNVRETAGLQLDLEL